MAHRPPITDMTRRERAIFAPLIVMTILLGVYPSLVTDITGSAVENLLADVETAQAAYTADHMVADAGDQ